MWNISWVLLRDFDRKIEDAPRRCEICATPDDRRPKSQSRREMLDRSDEDETSCRELRVHRIPLQFVAVRVFFEHTSYALLFIATPGTIAIHTRASNVTIVHLKRCPWRQSIPRCRQQTVCVQSSCELQHLLTSYSPNK